MHSRHSGARRGIREPRKDVTMSADGPTASDERNRDEIESVLRDIEAAQQEAARDFRPELSAASHGAAGGGPLLSPKSVRLDRGVFESLLRAILGVLGRWTGDAGSNEAIGEVRLSEECPALLLADAVRGGGALHERAKSHDIEGDVFALAVRYALRPFLEAYANELRREGRFDPESLGAGLAPGERGEEITCSEPQSPGGGGCPVCGAGPFIAEFDEEDGRKRLSCGLCGTKWRFPRLKCPFCGNEDQAKLGYLEVEGLEGYRAYVCDVCRGYMKAVDRRVISPAPSPELADAVTPELDEAALERGYCTRRTSCDTTDAHRTRP